MIKMLPALWTLASASLLRTKTSLAYPPLTSAVTRAVTCALTGSRFCGAASAGASAVSVAIISARQNARRLAPNPARSASAWSDLDTGQTARAPPAQGGAEVEETMDLLDRRNCHVRAHKTAATQPLRRDSHNRIAHLTPD